MYATAGILKQMVLASTSVVELYAAGEREIEISRISVVLPVGVSASGDVSCQLYINPTTPGNQHVVGMLECSDDERWAKDESVSPGSGIVIPRNSKLWAKASVAAKLTIAIWGISSKATG